MPGEKIISKELADDCAVDLDREDVEMDEGEAQDPSTGDLQILDEMNELWVKQNAKSGRKRRRHRR